MAEKPAGTRALDEPLHPDTFYQVYEHLMTGDSPEEMQAWIAARKSRFPTRQRREQSKAQDTLDQPVQNVVSAIQVDAGHARLSSAAAPPDTVAAPSSSNRHINPLRPHLSCLSAPGDEDSKDDIHDGSNLDGSPPQCAPGDEPEAAVASNAPIEPKDLAGQTFASATNPRVNNSNSYANGASHASNVVDNGSNDANNDEQPEEQGWSIKAINDPNNHPMMVEHDFKRKVCKYFQQGVCACLYLYMRVSAKQCGHILNRTPESPE
jgi:hypothetical protein